jgi:hypothetical protein
MRNISDPTSGLAFPSWDVQFERGAEHLYQLGTRALAEFLAEHGKDCGCAKALREHLDRWRALTPEVVALAGGDRFPPRLSAVPL